MNKRLVILISGGGSNLQALIDAAQAGHIHAQIVGVFSNRRDAYGLERAKLAGIEGHYVPLKPYKDAGKSREDYDADLAEKVRALAPDLVVLAGWMHVFSSAFLDHFPHKVINLHPALPGVFAGIHAIERAYEAFQRGEIEETGCMVHYVIPEVDAGPVVAHAVVPILPDDSLQDLEDRMHQTEHQLLVNAVMLALEGSTTPE